MNLRFAVNEGPGAFPKWLRYFSVMVLQLIVGDFVNFLTIPKINAFIATHESTLPLFRSAVGK